MAWDARHVLGSWGLGRHRAPQIHWPRGHGWREGWAAQKAQEEHCYFLRELGQKQAAVGYLKISCTSPWWLCQTGLLKAVPGLLNMAVHPQGASGSPGCLYEVTRSKSVLPSPPREGEQQLASPVPLPG